MGLEARENERIICGYCNGKRTLKSSNFCGSAELRIVGEDMEIFGDESIFHLFKRIYKPRFRVFYCPMCGKPLEMLDRDDDGFGSTGR